MRKDNNEPIGKVRYQLGTLEEHTTFDAESVGILLSLHLLQQHIDELGSKNCSASLDGKSVIEATQKLRLGTGQHIIEQIHNTARIMATKAKMEKAFTLAWVPGHCGLEGNELADIEAKEATKSGSSGALSLPTYLRKALPASIAAIKQTFHKSISAQWTRQFESSPRYQRTIRIDEAGTKSKFMKETAEMGRCQTSILVQLRLGHIPLNQHLHRIRKVDVPFCPNCEKNGKQIVESVKHFILECPTYAKERFWLRTKLGRGANSIKLMMSNEKTMKLLIRYVGKTERLKSSFGDVPTT